jgi:hypothetical protein
MKPEKIKGGRVLRIALLFAIGALTIACQGGGGMGLEVSYPGRYYGPMDAGGGWGGGPVWN